MSSRSHRSGLRCGVALLDPVNALADAAPHFVYRSGAHLDVMRRRREWFHKMTEHHLVLWWIPAGHLPDLDEALHRLDLLRRGGPGPLAFTFREPYGPPAAGTRSPAAATVR